MLQRLLHHFAPPGWVVYWVVRMGNLHAVNLSDRDLTGANLSGSLLNGARFTSARIRHADFSAADCEGSNFSRVNFSSASGDVWRLEKSPRPYEVSPGIRSRQGEVQIYGKREDLFNALNRETQPHLPTEPLPEE